MADVSQIKLPNGSVYDLIDEKSGYITAEYIENKTDYEIPVSRVGEIVVGETAIGTDSTNFPTSKAVVDYVDERVVQEIDAIDVGVTGIKANGASLAVENGIVNIPVVGPSQSVGLMTNDYMANIYEDINVVSNSIPTSTSQLTNDSGFITASDIPTVPTKTSDLTNDSGFITSDSDEKLKIIEIETTSQESTYYPIVGIGSNAAVRQYENNFKYSTVDTPNTGSGAGTSILTLGNEIIYTGTSSGNKKNRTGIIRLYGYGNKYVEIWSGNQTATHIVTLPNKTGTVALTSDIPTVPTNISSFTNDSGYLTASDIASVMTYKGTKANYAALPASGNTTGDVWHLTDTGAEWAWDGSAWQELGTAIDLSNYATKATTLAGYGITDAKIENGTITLGSNTITPLTSYTETDPTVPSWAKQSSKPTYTAAEVGALPDSTVIPSKTSDLTNDSGFLTTDSDEKLAISQVSGGVVTYPILGSSTAASTRQYDAIGFSYQATNSSGTGQSRLFLGNNTASGNNNNRQGVIRLYGSTAYWIDLISDAPTANRTITLPNASGTIALTSDIPDTSSFLTSETDPVFSASAAAGIGSSDITNWNGKIDNQYIGYLDNHNLYIPKEWTYYRGTSRFSYYVPFYVKGTNTSTISSTSKVRTIGTTTDLFSFGTIFIDNVRQSGTVTLEENKLYMYHLSDGDTIIYTVANLSDIPDTSSFLTSETDPVFSASAAAGISATDISNWNGKSSTDEKLSVKSNSTVGSYYPILDTGTSEAASKKTYDGFLKFSRSSNTQGVLSIGENGSAIGQLRLFTTSSGEYVTITPGTLTSARTITLPNETGTVALTSDIPQVYSSTNTGGYLTMATLPIYDGTVV